MFGKKTLENKVDLCGYVWLDLIDSCLEILANNYLESSAEEEIISI